MSQRHVQAIKINLRLSTDLKADTLSGGLGVVDGLRAGLDVRGDAVVVRRGEGREVSEAVEGDGVLGRAEADGGGVLGDLALGHVVRGLSTDEEAITADDGVRGEGRALIGWGASSCKGGNGEGRKVKCCKRMGGGRGKSGERALSRHQRRAVRTYLENVKERAGVETGLLVGGGEERGLGTGVGGEGGGELELDTLGDLVVNLDLGLEDVARRP